MKKTFAVLSTALIASGLVGCGANNYDTMDRYNNNTRPIGYYSNYNDNGDYREGPITDMVDRNEKNGANKPDMAQVDRRNGLNGPGYMRNDRDYSMYDNTLSKRLADRIEKLNNVEDARVIVYGDQIMVGVDTNDSNQAEVEKDVRREVGKVTKQKNLTVSTDKDIFGRMDKVDNRLRNGDGFNEVQGDVNAILTDIADIAKRPFQNNR
ncbi:YhcN/YlaJ family sporulation lipoprotein [Pseudalkalibacillus caeni]|uniref:Spore cortex protein n=1 Tax=Exobacillus caeni TaxID=2574798 RepID=A0A5R9FEG3_9BACL|nr:YhcN/YlaJ family sporulation lipoprotein [Pseudalkalibacillus caeni]TLS39263.1 hypothetical protein FCL54_02855 [Pseudalkalibacillus caeni]